MRQVTAPVRKRLARAFSALLGPTRARRLALAIRHPGHYRALKGFLEIEGWLGISEAVFLYNLAGSIPNRESILVVEIGTWQGRSAVVLGQALVDRKTAKVVCIDPFNADGDLTSRRTYESRARQRLREICVANLRKHGLDHVVQVIEGYSHDVIRSWGERFDLLFIDGNHDYAAVRRDFEDWAPFLRPNGWVVFDDAYVDDERSGPGRVVREFVLDQPGWSDGRSVGTLYAARKR